MLETTRGAMRALAILLLVTVATQIFYITVVSAAGDETPLRPATWLVELFAFVGIAVSGITLAVRDSQRAHLWSLVALSGLFNMLQIAMGLSMFGPASEASETVPNLFATILGGAFFFYFLAKLLLGLAALAIGGTAVRGGAGLARIFGGLAALAGGATVVIGFLAMLDRDGWMFPAGAAGTAVAALFALTLLTAKDS
ncbi:hypothetical protein [Erythrobacter mangrovi]|uniref:Thiamine biosynthesis protein ThiC n=1 Tax=Erythrobacter mangrovi TaxID=2739433 RepID=A0A7D4CD88_9SPHN|nr:hypothetical protein [Erythrobacter mangrovi]QKG71429.1 hypothetical protein HQR01_08665 [Erythrobacter mangrovi]